MKLALMLLLKIKRRYQEKIKSNIKVKNKVSYINNNSSSEFINRTSTILKDLNKNNEPSVSRDLTSFS